MNKTEAKEEILHLSKQINHHNHLYYVESNPVISDYEFDMMLKRWQVLEAQFPEFACVHRPPQRVGGEIT
ncbi:MAG: DNA ligase LigA-related protein, partial [Flavobacteriales bacterium]